ncbi:hypothetical protein [Enterococcus malodoratus]|uniref:YokE-like PH domain-containing protein n=1 Tax=Enterococcus malodoratus ATCC 43197 TaxID=1158601 RepID=R2R7J1_9ENTE|nr:hypothetical protein [Enterococcus malodoratus]EOH71904.1 hypothetical protein UAI_04188 [Enterococcus malodoratus ATCC 43197]EOT70072.1 hypothetical protein I585_01551 [Enterococcus malodoratus ATCC 43197]OJG66275.1 hypothetical protein RV07_GL000068 [Enterococcus malodoratus]SPW74805.1 Uncharacterised protein [Enterococcus malodoratus]STD65283.1 Uncharacterised protein [Enterococcus malodoratus]
MNDFKQVFSQSQQFLILQAYIDSQLSSDELMNFTLLETVDEIPVVFYSAGVMIIDPAIDLDQFTHVFFPITKLELQQNETNLTLILFDRKLQFQFSEVEETKQVAEDLIYLYSNRE